jgi:hypothetical protein
VTVTPDTIVTGVNPFDISEERFTSVLTAAGSPAAPSSHEAYATLGTMPVSIAFCLAVFHHESSYGKAGVTPKYETKNPGNCRSSRTGAGTVISTERGPFVKYPSWPEGWKDLAFRLIDETYVYVKEGRNTIREIIERFAPASDNNVPSSYINAVVRDMNAWIEDPPVGTPYEHVIPGMIDVRSQLATATQGQGGVVRGPYERIALSAKRGVVVHYRGVATDVNAGLASFKADATYHVGKNWARNGETPVLGSGIMYHIGIDGQGNVYLLRDLERVLWHCGSWPENEVSLAIQLPLGGNQRATSQQLAALERVVDDYLVFTGEPISQVWGHQELSPTTCPGTLMNDFVRPYRNTPPPPPDELVINDIPIVAGFRNHFLRIGKEVYPQDPVTGGIAVFGMPLATEYPTAFGSAQRFERYMMEWWRDNKPPFDIIGTHRGAKMPEGVT